MFKRLIFDHWLVIFPIVSFVVTAVVYFFITWSAMRMRPAQVEHLANLPLSDTSPTVDRHDSSAE